MEAYLGVAGPETEKSAKLERKEQAWRRKKEKEVG